MGKKYFIYIFFFLSLLFPLISLANNKVAVKLLTDPPDVGINKLSITITSDDKTKLKDLNLEAILSMPAMGTMPYMEVQGDLTSNEPGNYLAEVEISMGGTWDFTLNIKPKIQSEDAKQEIYRYSLTTGIPGLIDKNIANSSSVSSANTTLNIGPERLQKIGVRFAEVKKQNMVKNIRAIGLVESDVSKRSQITLRYNAYLKSNYGHKVGDNVKAGDLLAKLESPELVAAEQEFLLALEMQKDGHLDSKAAAERLLNLGLSNAAIEKIKKTKKIQPQIELLAPVAGSIIEANASEGSTIDAGSIIYIIGDQGKNYILAKLFQQDLFDIKIGQDLAISIPGTNKKSIPGKVDLIYPSISEGSGTTNVRIKSLEKINLLSGQYVELTIPVNYGAKLAIPSEAILFSGLHAYTFIDKGNGILEPREVETGRMTGTLVEIISGLSNGEKVVASGTFLLSAEASLRSALPKWKTSPKNGEGK